MENKIENPNAFPIALKDNGNHNHPGAKGMSLRDYFAAKVMSLLYMGVGHEIETAKRSYAVADAMLKERSKEK